jgi:hypothetical protein
VVIATIVAIPIFFRTQIARVIHAVRGDKETEPTADDRVDAS